MDDADSLPLIPSGGENRLFRAPSEHELSISRSLQKLDLPEWFKNSTLNRRGSGERLFGVNKKSERYPKWADLRQKSTSTSSLPVITRPSTPGSLCGKTMTTPTKRYYNYNCTPTSPSPVSTPFTFSRRTSKDEISSGQYFQYPSSSTPPVSTSRCTSPFVALGGFSYSQPYTGWRSSERLARDYAVENEDDIKSYDHSYVTSSNFYWSPEERLSHGPGYYAMKFGIHPGIFNKQGSGRLSNFDEQLSNLMSGNYKQSGDEPVLVSSGDKVTSAVEELDRMMSSHSHHQDVSVDGGRFSFTKPEIIDVIPKKDEHVIATDRRYFQSKQTIETVTETVGEKSGDVATKSSAFVNIAGTKLAQPWATTNIGETTFPTLFCKGANEIQTDEVDEISSEIGQLSIWKEIQLHSKPLSSSNVNNTNEFQPIIYDLSMIDSTTARALGLPVMQSTIKSPSSDFMTFSTSIIPCHQKVFTESELSDSQENDIDDNEDGNVGGYLDNEYEEKSSKFPIYPPTSPPTPKPTTTTVTKLDGRIAEIVEVPTDNVSSSSKQSSISFLPDTNMFLPLRVSTVQTVSVTPSSGSSVIGSGSSLSPNRPTAMPLTTTTFITTFHKDNVLSPDIEQLTGKTRTLILLNEGSTPAASPKFKNNTFFKPISGDADDGQKRSSQNDLDDTSRQLKSSEILNDTPQFEMLKMSNDEKCHTTDLITATIEKTNGHDDSQSNSEGALVTSETTVQSDSDTNDDLLYDSPVLSKSSKQQNDIKLSLSENSSTEETANDSSIASVEMKSEAEFPSDSPRVTYKIKRTSSIPIETSSKWQSNFKVSSRKGKMENELKSEAKTVRKSSSTKSQNGIKLFSTESQSSNLSMTNGSFENPQNSTENFQKSIPTLYRSENDEFVIKELSNDVYNSSMKSKIATTEISDKSNEDTNIQSVGKFESKLSLSDIMVCSSDDKISQEASTELKTVDEHSHSVIETSQNRIEKSELHNGVTDIALKSSVSTGALSKSTLSRKTSDCLTLELTETSQEQAESSENHFETPEKNSETTNIHLDISKNHSEASKNSFTKLNTGNVKNNEAIRRLMSASESENEMTFETFTDLSLSSIDLKSAKGLNTQLSAPGTFNQSYDSFVTAETHPSTFSREISMDTSMGTIVHRIGYTARNNMTDTSTDDLTSDFDSMSVRMRGPTDEQRSVRHNVRSDLIDETVIVRCQRVDCKHTTELHDARINYKTCSNCYTYYCSHHCRKDDKERHRRLCLHERSRNVCKQALNFARENEEAIGLLSKLAKDGAAKLGNGYVRITLPSTKAGLKFIRRGFERLEIPATYLSVANINVEELGEEVCSMLQNLCENYDSSYKFILLVTMFINKEVVLEGVPHWERNVIAKCAKIRLSKKYEEENVVHRPRSRKGSTSSLRTQKSWRWSWA
ncbi:hypothetical protein CHUAL_001190 [Chamberlinius hualienensis]